MTRILCACTVLAWIAASQVVLADLAADLDTIVESSEMRPYIERYSADRALLRRSYPVELSPARHARLKKFVTEWLERLTALDFDGMGQHGKVDYILFRNHLQHEDERLNRSAKEQSEIAPLLPFASAIIELEESRRRMEFVNPQEAAGTLDSLTKRVAEIRKSTEESLERETPDKTVSNRAAVSTAELSAVLRRWFDFYNGYDPLFTWWAAEAHERAQKSLHDYAVFLREKVAGVKGGGADLPGMETARQKSENAFRAPRPTAATSDSADDIIGTPIGREGLIAELAHEMIPYTPEELIALANKEFAWCEDQMKKAARELGFGDDWKKALEHVKNLYLEPGKQPSLIRDLEREAEAFLDKHDLITIPPLVRETWRMQMMTPERQLVNPFFTGGEVISVSYPVDSMAYEQKLMSMRGNNIHFSRATVFHELIPGHGLQAFMSARYRPYRAVFGTPFNGEGWALYWEMVLWDMGFHSSPEDRVGALFWRMHRCARIVFSLSFHLGQMTPQECVNLLVERVGHERDNAIGEVRRSFAGNYSPLYQSAYLLGGLQFYNLRKELVDSGKMTNKQFHDAVLKLNRVSVEMIRATLLNAKLSRGYQSVWKFYGSMAPVN